MGYRRPKALDRQTTSIHVVPDISPVDVITRIRPFLDSRPRPALPTTFDQCLDAF